jgi:hypothetical protein
VTDGDIVVNQKAEIEAFPPSPIYPLDTPLSSSHASLQKDTVAAVWVDHAKEDDFNLEKGRTIAQAGLMPPEGNQRYHWICAEGAYSGSAHAAYLTEEYGRGLRWELLAAAVPRVAVLDERVQSEKEHGSARDVPLSTVWPCMGVWVPDKTMCDLDHPSFDACRDFLASPTVDSDQHPIDFLVIHLTVLESLSKKVSSGNLEKALEKLIDQTEAKKAVLIIVTGRGVPTAARENGSDHVAPARYLPISALLESLVSRPSKLALMRTLWSAARPKKTDK